MPIPGPGLISVEAISPARISPVRISAVPIPRVPTTPEPTPAAVPASTPARTSRRPDARRRGRLGCGVPLRRSSSIPRPAEVPAPVAPLEPRRYEEPQPVRRALSAETATSGRPGPNTGERAPMQDGWVRPRGPAAPAPATGSRWRTTRRPIRRRARRSRRFPTYSTWSGPMTGAVPPAKARRPSRGPKHPRTPRFGHSTQVRRRWPNQPRRPSRRRAPNCAPRRALSHDPSRAPNHDPSSGPNHVQSRAPNRGRSRGPNPAHYRSSSPA